MDVARDLGFVQGSNDRGSFRFFSNNVFANIYLLA
jgi:hypothetical protein